MEPKRARSILYCASIRRWFSFAASVMRFERAVPGLQSLIVHAAAVDKIVRAPTYVHTRKSVNLKITT
ncbi:unnamed protein product, partial [Chrysoparadoxa australica]